MDPCCSKDLDRDPDYVDFETASKSRGSASKTIADKSAKIREICLREIDKEIRAKQNELLLINERCFHVQALLDVIRTVSVQNYYNRHSTDTSYIHPKIKPYLAGKRPRFPTYADDHPISPSTSEGRTTRLGGTTNVGRLKRISEGHFDSQSPSVQSLVKIVVGNVSQFLKDESDPGNSVMPLFKWMAYVRTPSYWHCDISEYVSKVKFVLHASYKPFDSIEIEKPPFYLVRKGWGEFPLRVQLHFKDPKNRPIDVVHRLKLDQTHTGLQTVGCETIAEVMLFSPDHRTSPFKKVTPVPEPEMIRPVSNGLSPDVLIQPDIERILPLIDHDYCAQVFFYIKVVLEKLSEKAAKRSKLIDSNLMRKQALENFKITPTIGPNNGICVDNLKKSTSLVSVLHLNGYANSKQVSTLCNGISKKSSAAKRFVQCVTPEGRSLLVSANLPSESTLPQADVEFRNRILRLDLNTMKDPYCAIRWLAGHFDIVGSTDISDLSYQMSSVERYLSAPIGKRRAVEWIRALAIRKALLTLVRQQDSEFVVPSTKAIMIFLRRNGYTPLMLPAESLTDDCHHFSEAVDRSSNQRSEIADQILPSFTDVRNDVVEVEMLLGEQSDVLKSDDTSDTEIDIEGVEETARNSNRISPIKVRNALRRQSQDAGFVTSNAALFARSAAQQIGVFLKPYDLGNGVEVPVVEEMLGSMCERLCSDLVRSAVDCAFDRIPNGHTPATIDTADVYKAITRHRELADLVSNSSLSFISSIKERPQTSGTSSSFPT